MATDSPEGSKAGFSLTAQQVLSKGLTSAQAEGEYCDLLLSCQGRRWKAHRVVLCSWSSFFKNACKDGFKEGASGKIDLKEDDPDTVARMLRFCYTYDYGIIPDNQTAAPDTEDVPMMAHARIYFIADKYGIGLLKDLAKKNFQEVGKEKWRSESFPTVIEAIYENTLPSDGLRACLVSIIKQHKKDLSESVPFMDVVRSGGDFAADVFDGWTNDGVPTAKALGHKNLTAKILQDTFYCRTAGTQRWFTLWERDNGLCSVCGHRLFMDKQGKVLEHPT